MPLLPKFNFRLPIYWFLFEKIENFVITPFAFVIPSGFDNYTSYVPFLEKIGTNVSRLFRDTPMCIYSSKDQEEKFRASRFLSTNSFFLPLLKMPISV